MWFWVFDEYEKQIRKTAKTLKKEKGAVKKWLKLYRKVKKSVPQITNHYHQVRVHAQRILTVAREMEQLLIQALLDPEEKLSKADGQRIKELVEELRARGYDVTCRKTIEL